jgi:nucleotide-binding universal stress UspA family protein
VFENVLVGVDGRTGGRDAITLAGKLTAADGQLTLAHIYQGELNPMHAVTPGLLKEEREGAERLLERERTAADVSAELISIVAMSPGQALHLQAESQHADLLVVGSCHRGAFGRVMLGDDTRAALNGAPCAVAISSLGLSEYPTPIARVGVAYNGSPESEAALRVARELAAPTRASVAATEVVPMIAYAYSGVAPVAVQESIDGQLEEANSRLRARDVDGRAVYGLTGEELAAFGDEVDILVVGSRGYGPVRRLVLGSTSNYLERHARCSLLVLPRLAPAGTGPSADGSELPGESGQAAATRS